MCFLLPLANIADEKKNSTPTVKQCSYANSRSCSRRGRLVAIQAIDALLDIGCFAQPAASPGGSTAIKHPAQLVQGALEREALANAGCIFVGSEHTVAPVLHPPGVKEDRATGAG